MVGVGHSGDRVRSQRYNLSLSRAPQGLTFLTETQMSQGSDAGGEVPRGTGILCSGGKGLTGWTSEGRSDVLRNQIQTSKNLQ